MIGGKEEELLSPNLAEGIYDLAQALNEAKSCPSMQQTTSHFPHIYKTTAECVLLVLG